MEELITGNTYPVKDRLRALGGKWSPRLQGWFVPKDQAEEARAIVAAAGPVESWAPRATRRRYQRGVSTHTRFAGGAEVFTNRNGRCEDAPCCGCCD